jgi:hypothetical protein
MARAIGPTGYNHQFDRTTCQRGFQGQESWLGAASIKTSNAKVNETIMCYLFFLLLFSSSMAFCCAIVVHIVCQLSVVRYTMISDYSGYSHPLNWPIGRIISVVRGSIQNPPLHTRFSHVQFLTRVGIDSSTWFTFLSCSWSDTYCWCFLFSSTHFTCIIWTSFR